MMKNLLVSVASGAMALLAGEVLGGDWYVKSDAAEGGDGSRTAPFKTIQQAVDAASADDSVYVCPGVYDQGTTNAWLVNRSVPFDQQTRVYITKRLTIVSTGGRGVTTIKGSQGSVSDDATGKDMAYRTDGIQCVVIGAQATGTVIRGFTFEDGTAHQSAAPGNIAAGGLCAATPSSANDFLVTDSAFVRCFGRGGGGIHGGMAIRCLFEKCNTNTRGSSANESRLYNCISRDASYGNIGAAWDFCDCIAINCTTFNGFTRAGFCLSSSPRFGGTHYNSVSFGNFFSSTWSQLAGYSRGTSVNSLSDDRYEVNTPGEIDDTDVSQLSSLCLSPWANDFHPVKDGLLDGKGDRAHLTASDDFIIPSDEVNKDFFGHAIAADAPIPIGAILPAAEPKTGILKLVSQLSVNGADMATALAIVQSDKYPAEVRIGQSARGVSVDGQKPLMALQKDGVVRYFGQYDSIVQLMPKPGAELAWDIWTTESELYVGGDGADDGNAGTDDKPLATIQKAVDKASNRTIIHVRPGHYGVQNGTYGNEPGNMDSDSVNSGLRSSINIPSGKKVLIRSTNGAGETFIEGAPDADTGSCGPNATRCVAVNANANVAFSGFTFCNGYAYNNDFQTDADKSYGAAFACGGANYQHVYDCIFTGNHGRGIVQKGQYVRCLFTNNADIASCVVYASTLSACVFANNGKPDTAYILYNNVNAYNCSMYEPIFEGSLQNKNGHVVNGAYETSNGMMLDFDGNFRIVGSVVKAKSQPVQSYPAAMKYADPYFHAPWIADCRLQQPSEAVGCGVSSDPYGKVGDTDFTKYMHGDYLNRSLVHEDGTINAGAFAVALEEGMSDVYVDAENGHDDDEHDGLSENRAKKTLMAAVRTRCPGNARIIALPGHYNEGSGTHEGYSFQMPTAERAVRQVPSVSSRVIVPEGRALISRDGPETTFIEGSADPNSQDPQGLGRGPNAIRCVFLERNATVRGFTIRYGHTDYYDSNEDAWEYQDDFYGAGVLGRAVQANGGGKLDGASVENCIVTENYGDLGGAGGVVTFANCRVSDCWGVRFGGFFRHGEALNCYVDNCHGDRVCDVLYDCVNCTFGVGNAAVNGSATQPFANIGGSARVWNFLLLSPTPTTFKLGSNVKNIVIASSLTPEYGGTPENVYNELSLLELQALYTAGKAMIKTAPSVDAGCADALALLSDVDAAFQPRVANGVLDIGAFEYDWKSDYGKALGRHITVTAEKGVVESDGVVTLSDGASLSANWTGRKGLETDYQIGATVTGGGCLLVFLNGELVGEMTASGTIAFANANEVNALRFAYTGSGVASVDKMRRMIGMSLTIR